MTVFILHQCEEMMKNTARKGILPPETVVLNLPNAVTP